MYLDFLLLGVGFVLLIKGADFLVDGSSSIAKKFNISNLVIGLTVVAFGTSAPELFVNLFASFNGTTDIAIGNIVGSNIANTLLILGVASLIFPLKVRKGTVWREIPLGLFAGLLVLIMANDKLIGGQVFNSIGRIDGIILIFFFVIFLYYTIRISKEKNEDELEVKPKIYSNFLSLSFIVIGLLGLTLGGKWIIDSAVNIAKTFGLSDALIGLTIVAIGTSLPELATSVVAVFKKNADIAVGNVVGSNIFNIFWILGISSVIKPLPFSENLNFDLIVIVMSSALLFGWMFLGKRHILEKWQGAIFILLYIGYIAFIIMRG